MFCQYCGSPIVDDACFCPRCGKAVPKEPSSSSSSAPISAIRSSLESNLSNEFSNGGRTIQSCGNDAAVSVPASTASASDVKGAVDRVFSLFHDKDGQCSNATKSDAELVEKAAADGNARAMFLIGSILADGCDGFSKDPKASAEWYRKAAEAGDAWGMFACGALLADEYPDGVSEADFVAAKEWFSKACSLFAAQGETSGMQLTMLVSAVAKARERAGDAGLPDLGGAAAMAGEVLDSRGDAVPETTPAVDRAAIGFAHLVLALTAQSEDNGDLARDHLERGAAFGDNACQKALREFGNGETRPRTSFPKRIPPTGTARVDASFVPVWKTGNKNFARGLGAVWGTALVFSLGAWFDFRKFGSWDSAWESVVFRVFLIGTAVLLVLIAIVGDCYMFRKGGTKKLMEKAGAFLGILTIVWAAVFSAIAVLAVVIAVLVLISSWKQAHEEMKNGKIVGQRICPACKGKAVVWQKGDTCPHCGYKF